MVDWVRRWLYGFWIFATTCIIPFAMIVMGSVIVQTSTDYNNKLTGYFLFGIGAAIVVYGAYIRNHVSTEVVGV